MAKKASSFGITLKDVKSFYSNMPQHKVHNEPLRDVGTQDFWDFANEPIPTKERVLSQEVVGALREVLN